MLHLAQKPLNLKGLQIVLTIYYSSSKAVVFRCVIVRINISAVFCSIIVFMFIEYTEKLIFLAFEVK